MSDDLKHYGVMGMRWGKHKAQEQARYQSRRAENKRYNSERLKAPKLTVNIANKMAKTHERNLAKIDADFEKATGKKLPKGPVVDRLLKSLGAKQNSKGQWIMTPEAHMKATAMGIGLGTVAFFAEMKVKQFVKSGAAADLVAKAEYARWLKNG